MNKKRLTQLLAINLIALTVGLSVMSYVIIDNGSLAEKYRELSYLGFDDTENVLDIILDEPVFVNIQSYRTHGITFVDNTIYILCVVEYFPERYILEIEFNEDINLIINQVLHPLPLFFNNSLYCHDLGFDGTYFYTLQTDPYYVSEFLCTFNLTHGRISNRTLEKPSSAYPNISSIVRTNFEIWNDRLVCIERGELDDYSVVRNITMYDIVTLNWIESFNVTLFSASKTLSVDPSGIAWMYYKGNPLEDLEEHSKTRLYSISSVFLGYSLHSYKLESTIHIGILPWPANTSLEYSYNYIYNDTNYKIRFTNPVMYAERIITPLGLYQYPTSGFLGFRIYSFDAVNTMKTSELVTLIISFTTFIGFSTYTICLIIKKKYPKVELQKNAK